jgi:hypothetical protein
VSWAGRVTVTAELVSKLKADTEVGMSGSKISEKHGTSPMTYKKYKDLNFVYSEPKPKGKKKAA